VAFNRRHILRDGSVRRHGPCAPPDILCSEGPIDPEVGVLSLEAPDGRQRVLMLHHTCHPCYGFGANDVIGDWVGVWADLAREALGGSCQPIVVNGCCGNIHHTNHLDPDGYSRPGGHREMAAKLMETTRTALSGVEDLDTVPFRFGRRVLSLPLRGVPPEDLERARAMEKDWPEPKWEDESKTAIDRSWVDALTRLDYHDRQQKERTCPYEIQALRMGDAALVGLMGEPFVEGQLRIKLESPAKYTIVAHYCNGHAGYIPPASVFERSGDPQSVHVAQTNFGFKFEPDALDCICEEAVNLLESLFTEGTS
jgi:hypothetical protein